MDKSTACSAVGCESRNKPSLSSEQKLIVAGSYLSSPNKCRLNAWKHTGRYMRSLPKVSWNLSCLAVLIYSCACSINPFCFVSVFGSLSVTYRRKFRCGWVRFTPWWPDWWRTLSWSRYVIKYISGPPFFCWTCWTCLTHFFLNQPYCLNLVYPYFLNLLYDFHIGINMHCKFILFYEDLSSWLYAIFKFPLKWDLLFCILVVYMDISGEIIMI